MTEEQEQQINQLKEELLITQKAFAECSSSEMSCRVSLPLARKKIDELYAEIQSLKSQLEESHKEVLHLTSVINMPEKLIYLEAVQLLERCDKKNYQINDLKSKNEKYQKVIDEIAELMSDYDKYEDDWDGVKELHYKLKSILSKHKQGEKENV